MSVNITTLEASDDRVNEIQIDLELLEDEVVSQGVNVFIDANGGVNSASTTFENVDVVAGWSETVIFEDWGLQTGDGEDSVSVSVEVVEASYGQVLDSASTSGTVLAPQPDPDISVSTEVTDMSQEVLDEDAGTHRVFGTGVVNVDTNVETEIMGILEIGGVEVDQVIITLASGSHTIGVAGSWDVQIEDTRDVDICAVGEANAV